MNPASTILILLPLLAAATGAAAQSRQYLTDDWAETRAFSPAVATEGGRVIWLAGVTTGQDARGRSLAGDFDAQAREIFRIIEERLAHFGGSLSDIVTMTVYIKDVRDGDRFVDIRKEHFDAGQYPSSALITVVGFARPELLLEINATAVVANDSE